VRKLVIVDTHVHVGLKKYVPLEKLLEQMEKSKIDKAVLIQYRAGLEPIGNTDNTYISLCTKKYPQKLVAVGIVDWTKKDALETLEYWVKEHGIQGVRLDGMAKSPGTNKYAIWEKAAELGINVSVYGKLDQLGKIAEMFPNLKLHIEHLGMPNNNGDLVVGLAKYPNVSVKFSVSGLRAISKQKYPHEDAHPFFKLIYDRFGSKRIMWGSDFPVCLDYEGYDKAIDFIRKQTPYLTDEDKEWILGKSTLKMWHFKE
jgi:predicted TIM-barrel fold metal-dependent hydrolase